MIQLRMTKRYAVKKLWSMIVVIAMMILIGQITAILSAPLRPPSLGIETVAVNEVPEKYWPVQSMTARKNPAGASGMAQDVASHCSDCTWALQ